MDSFDIVFEQEFFAKVKMETIQYARQQVNGSEFAKWKTVTLSELDKFLPSFSI